MSALPIAFRFGVRDLDAVVTELRFRRDLPRLLGHAVRIEVRGERVFLAAAVVRDRDLAIAARVRGHHDALTHVPANEVLHRHGLARAKQRPVEHRVIDGRVILRARFEAEIVRRDAFVPARQHEAEILRTARRDEQRR